MSCFIFPLWAQRPPNGLADIVPILIMLLVFVLPSVLKYFAEQAAKKKQQEIEERQRQKHLHDAFHAPAGSESPPSPPKPKKERRRKKSELVLKVDDDRPAHGTPLSRELAPQGEGDRFAVKPGTLDASQVLMPSVEPFVQPMLESMTGIYDAPMVGEQSVNQTLLARSIAQMLTTSEGVRQAVVLSEIFKRPEY